MNKILTCQWLYYWKDGSVTVRFTNEKSGYSEIKTYKTKAAAKARFTVLTKKLAKMY